MNELNEAIENYMLAESGEESRKRAKELRIVVDALQSRLESLEKDAARLDWLESSKESHGFCHSGHGEYMYHAHQMEGYKTVREVIDTAMQANKGE